MKKFNLIDEPWIPCITPKGDMITYSIKDLLRNSKDLSEIRDSSPIVTLSIYRLILSIIQRSYDVSTLDKWKKLFEIGSFDNAILSYLDNDKIKNRFYLIDSDNMPFLQDMKLKDDKDNKAVVLSKLAREKAATTNSTLFDHSNDINSKTYSFDEAARLLVADYFYCLSDGSGYAKSQNTNGVNLLASGNNIFETLMMNTLIRNTSRPFQCNDLVSDLPVWEQEKPYKEKSIPSGYLDFLTWPYRRLLLVAENDTVKEVYRKKGGSIDFDWMKSNYDPMNHYKDSKKDGYYAVSFKEEKALWRDYSALMSIVKQGLNDKLPYFVNQLARDTSKHYSIMAIGTCHGNADVQFWRQEKIPVNYDIMQNDQIIIFIENSLDLLEKYVYKLKKTIEDIDKSKSDIVYMFYSGMANAFDSLISILPDTKKAADLWEKAIITQSNNVWNKLLNSASNNSKIYKEIIINQDRLNRNLNKTLNEYLTQETES